MFFNFCFIVVVFVIVFMLFVFCFFVLELFVCFLNIFLVIVKLEILFCKVLSVVGIFLVLVFLFSDGGDIFVLGVRVVCVVLIFVSIDWLEVRVGGCGDGFVEIIDVDLEGIFEFLENFVEVW